MKRFIFLTFVALLAWSAWADDPADHPVVGRFQGSTVSHQERSTYGQINVPVNAEEIETFEGEVLLTLYRAPDDASTFTVYSTYTQYLQSEGFTLLVDCAPGTCSASSVEDPYGLAPFADNGNYNYSAPITNGNWVKLAFISAVREAAGETIYVNISIASGWYDFTQYKVDVVELGGNTGSIVSSGTREDETATGDAETSTPAAADVPTAATAPTAPTAASAGTAATTSAAGFLSNSFFRARGGYASYSFVDPVMAGAIVINEHSITGTSGSASGFRNLHGPFAQVGWFPNPNLGFVVDGSSVSCDHDDDIGDKTYSAQAELILARAGVVIRSVGETFPASMGLGFGGGVAFCTFYQAWTGGTDEVYLVAEDFLFPVIHCAAELTIPVVSIGRLTAGLEYVYIPVGHLTFEHDGGSEYSVEYREPNLGGLSLRIGLAAEL